MKFFQRSALLAAALLAIAASPAPTLPALPGGQAAPIAKPYDITADAKAQVDEAFAEARQTHKNVLLDFGGNWCTDCRMLAGTMALPPVQNWVGQNFVPVMIDIGPHMTRNLDIAARYGVKITAVPSVLIVTPEGKLVNGNDVFGLADARHFSAQAMVNLLAKWQQG